jgi:predicted ATPase
MIKSLTFIKDYDLVLSKDSQKRFGTKTIKPNKNGYSREKHPYKVFFLFRKGLQIDFNEDVNIIVGENGSGKSTLFSLIRQYAGKQPDRLTMVFGNYKTEDEYIEDHRKNYKGELQIDGDINYKNTIFFSAEHDNPVVSIPKMLNPDSHDFPAMVNNLFNAQEESHGESLIPVLKYILENARNCHIFLDEPDTALSLRNQIWLVKAIQKSAKKNGNQIFVCTHALALINQFNQIYDMENREWRDKDNYINEMLK